MSASKHKIVNAHMFNQRVVEDSFSDNFFKVLLREFDPHFFSHLHDILLDTLPKEQVIAHFYDFFAHLCRTYDGSDVSRCYYFYYKELSRVVDGAQALVWNLLFSFYVLLDKSPELRAIRFALEKSKGKDAVEFFLSIKEMVAAVLSLNIDSLILDNTWIQPSELAQALSAIYDGKSISKMHLLTAVQNRCDSKGIVSGEFAAILLVDFVKTREKEELLKSKPKDKDSLTFVNNKAMARTKQKFNLDFSPGEREDDPDGPSPAPEQPFVSASSQQAQKQVTPRKSTKREDSKEKQKAVKENMIHTRQDLIGQVNYITQERSKAEDNLVSCAALMRKNIKDYNELLKYSQDIYGGMMELYFRLKERQAANERGPKLPLKESQVKAYKDLDAKIVKSMREELKNIVQPTQEDNIVFPLVSSPHKHINKKAK